LLWQLSVGFALAAVIGYLGYRRGALSKSGVVGAILTGGVIFGFGGLSGAALLLAFFISSSLLSRFKESQKEKLAEKFSKGSQRDLWQALANGGVAALCIGLYTLTDQPAWWAAAATALAAANADTWATELGVLSKTPPRLITNNRVVEAGTSGGISMLGTSAAFSGAVLIALTGLFAVIFDPSLAPLRSVPLVPLLTFAGLFGSLFDSLLGATVQAIYFCDSCRKETERYPAHRCGSPTRQIRGWRWLNNDWVNFLATAVGAGLMSFVIFFL